MNFRIRKGTHVSHFHRGCPLWPTENFYEQERPLWWGNLCDECAKLTDFDAIRGLKNGTEGQARKGRLSPQRQAKFSPT